MEILWLVGKFVAQTGRGIVWEFQGIFETKELAVAACRTEFYCVQSVLLNEQLPDELTPPFADCEYPKRDKADRSAQILSDGSPVPDDRSHTNLRPDGQQEGYVILSDNERAKGFVRPYRDAYKHLTCGKITTMGRKIAETYARDPGFYSGTFCTTCAAHFPVGEDGEFVWYEMDGSIGPKVGT